MSLWKLIHANFVTNSEYRLPGKEKKIKIQIPPHHQISTATVNDFLFISQFIPNLHKIHGSNLYFFFFFSGQCPDKISNNKDECWKAMQKQDHVRKLFAFSDRQNVNESISIPISIILLTQLFCHMDFTVSLTCIFTSLMFYLNRFSLLKMLNLAFFLLWLTFMHDLELNAIVASCLSPWEFSFFVVLEHSAFDLVKQHLKSLCSTQ